MQNENPEVVEITEDTSSDKPAKGNAEQVHRVFIDDGMDSMEWAQMVSKNKGGDIAIPSMSVKAFTELFENRPKMGEDSFSKLFYQALQSSYQLRPSKDGFQSSVDDPEREFVQELDYQGTKLRLSKPRFDAKSNTHLSGEMAATRLSMLLGNGGLVVIPLYHSGFWVTLKRPSETRLLDLEYEIYSSKIDMGRMVGGAVFSNDQVYLSRAVVKLFNDCLYATTLVDKEGDVLSKIKLPDLQTIAWGLACAIYPNGYPYSRCKISEDGYSDELIHGKLALDKIFWVDRKALSEKQIKHMVKRFNANMSNESLEAYQSEFKYPNEKKVKLKDNFYCILSQPNIIEHLESGEAWVNKCISIVDNVVSSDGDVDERNTLVNRYAKAMFLGQYRHYIKAFVYQVDEHEERYEDKETIDITCETLAQDAEIRDNFLDGVREFIDGSLVSIIATPTVDDHEANILPRFPELVPMDALYVFFRLIIQLTNRITARE